MHHLPEPDYGHLIHLCEQTRRRDPAAREELKGWFDRQAATMWAGREARRQLGMLAYLVAEKRAQRQLSPGSRYGDLANDPRSVAARHWERFQPFCEEVDHGADKTVDQFVAWVNNLTDHVLQDMVREMHRHEHEPIPLDPVADGDEDDEAPGGFVGLDEQIEGLHLAYQVLPQRLFLLKLLHRSCGLKITRIAKILGTSAYFVNKDLDLAQQILDRLDDAEGSPAAGPQPA